MIPTKSTDHQITIFREMSSADHTNWPFSSSRRRSWWEQDINHWTEITIDLNIWLYLIYFIIFEYLNIWLDDVNNVLSGETVELARKEIQLQLSGLTVNAKKTCLLQADTFLQSSKNIWWRVKHPRCQRCWKWVWEWDLNSSLNSSLIIFWFRL